MSPKTLVNFFFKKIGFNNLLFKSTRSEIVNTDGDSVEAALKRLKALSPFPAGSSVSIGERSILSDQVDVQIIVPCYNVQKYVYHCLKSINLRHSYIVTVIDDGSTDLTKKILDKFASDPHFEILHKINGGASSARNAGMAKGLKGKYLFFLDSDDFIDSSVLDSMLDIAFKKDLDIVQGNIAYVTQFGMKKYTKHFKHGDITADDLCGITCDKLIKSDLFFNLKFPDGFYFEDTIMSLIVFQCAHRVYGYNRTLYFYRYVPESTSKQLTNVKNIETLFIVLRIFEDRKKLGLQIDSYSYSRFINQSFFLYSRLVGLGISVVQDAFIVYSAFIQKVAAESRFELPTYRLKELEISLLNSDFMKFVAAAKYL